MVALPVADEAVQLAIFERHKNSAGGIDGDSAFDSGRREFLQPHVGSVFDIDCCQETFFRFLVGMTCSQQSIFRDDEATVNLIRREILRGQDAISNALL